MADQLGALQLPVAAYVPGTAAGDPALDAIAGYLTAILNAYVGPAWSDELGVNGAAPGQRVVQKTFTTNPENGCFQKEDMPTLFVWRPTEGDSSEQWTDDLVRVQTNVALLWITRPADQPKRAARSPIGNAVAAAIRSALHAGRDPVWVDPLDTEPTAATEGSALMARAGLSEWPRLTTCKPQSITIQLDESEPRPYWAVAGSIAIAELLTRDVTAVGSPDATPTTPTVNAPSKVDIDMTAGAIELESIIPTT
jgi:hypothetical protein